MKQEHENTYPKTQIILSESSFDGKNVVISFDLSENKGISGEEDVSKCFAECGLDLIYSEINASIRPRYIKWNNSVRGYNKSVIYIYILLGIYIVGTIYEVDFGC